MNDKNIDLFCILLAKSTFCRSTQEAEELTITSIMILKNT